MGTRFQNYCQQCRKPTLHERDPGTVNHVLHLLMTLLCCLMWLPIWMLLTLTQPKRRVRCLTCGLAIGDRAPIEREEAADARAKKITDRRDAKIEQAEIRREKAEAEAEARANALAVKAAAKAAAAPAANDSTAEAKEGIGARMLRALKSGVVTAIPMVKSGVLLSLNQVDAILKKTSGDDPFLHSLFRGLLVATMMVVGTIVLYSIAKAVGRA